MASARLEIHQLNVGQGDSILIINRNLDKVADAITAKSGTTLPSDPMERVPYAIKNTVPLDGTVVSALLIDGGDDEYGGDVVDYMRAHGVFDGKAAGFCPNLTVLVSHFHDDHMAGLRSLFKMKDETKGAKVKGAKAPGLVARYRPAHVYQACHPGATVPVSARFAAFQADLNAAQAPRKQPTKLHTLDPGGLENGAPAVISLGVGVNNIPIKVHVLAAAQGVYNPLLKRVVKIESVSSAVDQNDRSIVVMLEYGSFRFFAGGDIAGDGGAAGGNTGQNMMQKSGKRYYSVHADVESILGPALEAKFPATPKPYVANGAKYPWPGYCTVMKADHHGSSSSVDVHLLATMRPRIVLISSGVKSRFHRHPTPEVMHRLTSAWTDRRDNNVPNSIDRVYLTEMASKVRKKPFGTELGSALIMGDIVVRPVDESIADLDAGTVTRLQVQVYGTGVRTEIYDQGTVLRQTVNVNPQSSYPIGPFPHYDDH
jgi:hypothetical protein